MRIKATFSTTFQPPGAVIYSCLRLEYYFLFQLAFAQHNINLRIYSSKYYKVTIYRKKEKKILFLFASLGSLAHRATSKVFVSEGVIRVAPWVLNYSRAICTARVWALHYIKAFGVCSD